MARKVRATEITGRVRIASNGQHMKCNYICVSCNAVGRTPRHYSGCKKKEVYSIPAIAQAPRKGASKRKWDIFKKQFVYSKPIGFWFHEEDSWWHKNKQNKK